MRSGTCWPVNSGLTCSAPNSALNPVYPPGSVGTMSVTPGAHAADPCAQWTAKPTRLVWARLRAALPEPAIAEVVASANWGEPEPNIVVTSPLGPVPVFSRTMLAEATAPTSQPARVNGAQGAGMFVPSG